MLRCTHGSQRATDRPKRTAFRRIAALKQQRAMTIKNEDGTTSRVRYPAWIRSHQATVLEGSAEYRLNRSSAKYGPNRRYRSPRITDSLRA